MIDDRLLKVLHVLMINEDILMLFTNLGVFCYKRERPKNKIDKSV